MNHWNKVCNKALTGSKCDKCNSSPQAGTRLGQDFHHKITLRWRRDQLLSKNPGIEIVIEFPCSSVIDVTLAKSNRYFQCNHVSMKQKVWNKALRGSTCGKCSSSPQSWTQDFDHKIAMRLRTDELHSKQEPGHEFVTELPCSPVIDVTLTKSNRYFEFDHESMKQVWNKALRGCSTCGKCNSSPESGTQDFHRKITMRLRTDQLHSKQEPGHEVVTELPCSPVIDVRLTASNVYIEYNHESTKQVWNKALRGSVCGKCNSSPQSGTQDFHHKIALRSKRTDQLHSKQDPRHEFVSDLPCSLIIDIKTASTNIT